MPAQGRRFESLPAMPFYFGLALSGLATCLLGPVLPVLSARWSLSDTQGGWLFAAQFAASTLGAIVSSYSPRRSVALGFAAIAAGMALLASAHYGAALLAFGLIGAGLGAAVSATNLIFGTEYPERRGALLTAVNLCWGAGAVLAAGLVALAVREGALRIFLLLLAACALILLAAFAPFLRRPQGGDDLRERSGLDSGTRFDLGVFLLFSAVLFLYVGAETAVAGWIATYAHRLGGLNVEQASLFASAFWLAVVAGRVAVVLLLRVFAERVVLMSGLAVAMAGVATLLLPHAPAATIALVVVAGLGFAPVFPLLVARMLSRTGRTRHAGWIFAICGSGGAVVPWITGVVSQYGGGLREAFWAPLGALGGIVICVAADAAMSRGRGNFNQ
ncbi:MAG TPA: MFS transporter [Silvibacterium sp.]|nr:MFS transporter [Silvibacterium sp.]